MSPPEPDKDLVVAASFLQTVFAGQESGCLALFEKPSKRSMFVEFSGHDWYMEAARKAMVLREREDIYFAVGVQGQRPAKGRGKATGVVALPGLWADVDIAGPNHSASNLPPTEEDAWQIIRRITFQPTVVVHTGGGIQVYWLFREPLHIVTDKDRHAARRLSKTFQSVLAETAAVKGWGVDQTPDLCRLLRLPGTYNRKQKTPVPVTYELVGGGQRYNPSDFEEFLDLEADPELKQHVQGAAPLEPAADVFRILAGCPWLRHCKDDAATLPEPEWYRMLSIIGRCKDGPEHAHELSRAYSNYNAAETEAKLRQAMGAAGPVTCKFVESELGQATFCSRCNHRGKVKSPVVLGIGRAARRRKDASPSADEEQRSAAGLRLPYIQANDRQLRDVSAEAVDALRRSNLPPVLFVRGGMPVTVHQDETGRFKIAQATDPFLRNRLTRSADFYEIVDDKTRNCAPPMDIVKDIMAMAPMDWGFLPLHDLIEAPTIAEDGTLIVTPGYHAASGLYYGADPRLVLPEMAELPSSDHVEIGLAMLLDIIQDFPFVDEFSRVNMIAAMLTAICRPGINGPTPLALFDATTNSSGKTLLAEIVLLLATGRTGPLFSAPREPEEWRKQMTSFLIDGVPVVVMDNVVSCLDSAELAKALTETIHGDRILGLSQTVSLPVRCSWIATGNNIQLGGDMARRCYWIRLDPKCPTPFRRTGFKYKRLKQYVLAHRGELLAALLTLARAWFVAGQPAPELTPVGTFEEWSITIGGILQHAGVSGFLSNSDQLYEQADVELVHWEPFLRALDGAFNSVPFTVAQVWTCMNRKLANASSATFAPEAEAIREALPGYVSESMQDEGRFKQRLGVAFAKRVGRRYGAARIERAEEDRHGKVARWKVVIEG